MGKDCKRVQMVKDAMLEIYGDYCWMGYTVCRKNQYTYHHMRERRNGGKVTIDNGAILSHAAHNDLNTMEQVKPYYYKELNDLFYALNRTQAPPTKEYFEEVKKLLRSASRYIKLSSYAPDLSFEVIDDETFVPVTIFVPERYKELMGHKPIYIPEYEIPEEYRIKVKKKNRNKNQYIYTE